MAALLVRAGAHGLKAAPRRCSSRLALATIRRFSYAG